MQARRDILARIAALDHEIRSIATRHATVRLLMTVPGARRRTDHRHGRRCGLRRCLPVPTIVQRGGLSRFDAPAIRPIRTQRAYARYTPYAVYRRAPRRAHAI
jgi:hypothetical protein